MQYKSSRVRCLAQLDIIVIGRNWPRVITNSPRWRRGRMTVGTRQLTRDKVIMKRGGGGRRLRVRRRRREREFALLPAPDIYQDRIRMPPLLLGFSPERIYAGRYLNYYGLVFISASC